MPNLIANSVNYYKNNEINPWVFVDQDKAKKIQELKKLIHQSPSIPEKNEKNWETLLPYFSTPFLTELKETLIRENLRHLSKKHFPKN